MKFKANRITQTSANGFIQKQTYLIPSLRIIETNLETSFLASNLELVDGGDDPDIDW